jgi:hypothetical protein
MFDFIKTQYILYKSGTKSIGIEKIYKLAEKYMTKEERAELLEGGESNG